MADRRVRRSFLWVAVLVAGMLIGSVLMSTAGAAPAGPPGGLEVAEQNTDGDGFIAVHEQGVADVNVTGGSLDANVSFPATQNVAIAPATSAYFDGWVLATGGAASATIEPAINASLLSASAVTSAVHAPEVRVRFWSPITTDPVVTIDSLPQVVAIPLTQPIPIHAVSVECHNVALACQVWVSVVGD